MYLLNKRMPDSKKYIHVYTKSGIKTNEQIKKKKKNEIILDSNPHLLSGQDSLLSIRLLRNCDFSCIKVIVPQSKAHILRRLEERSLNNHMSQVNVDKQ